MAQANDQPTYPAISDLGDVVDLFTEPLFPEPIQRDQIRNNDQSERIYALFLDMLEFDLRRLGRILRGEEIEPALDNMPIYLDLATSGEPAVRLKIRWSAIHFDLILDRRARLTIWWFLPYTWSGHHFQITYLPRFTRHELKYSWEDDYLDNDLPPMRAPRELRNHVDMLDTRGRKFDAQFGIPVNHTVHLESGLMDILNKAVDTLNVATESRQSILSMGCKIFTIIASRDNPFVVASTITDFFLSLNIKGSVIGSAIDFITKHCINSWTAQSGIESNLRPLAMMMTCICTVAGTSVLPGQKLIDKVLHRMGLIGKACSGYNSITEQFQDLFNYIYRTCYIWMYGVPPEETELDQLLTELEEWYVETGKFLKLDVHDKITTDFETCRNIEILYGKGLDFSDRISKFKVSHMIRQPFTTHWIALTKLYERVVGQGARTSKPRTEPVCIHLYGGTGAGKSGLIFLLSQDLCNIEGMAHRTYDEIYFRMVEQVYWDDYHGQLVTVYDDFGQGRDSVNTPNKEFLEVIRTRNIAQFPLHMAHLDEKARTRFISRATILTSNHKNYTMESLTCSEAFKRRIDLQAKVQVKPEYFIAGTDQIDYEKCKEALSEDIYEFVLQHPSRPEVKTRPISYAQFSKLCVEKYITCYKRSKARIECLARRAERISRQTPAMEAQVADRELVIALDQALLPTIWEKVNDPNYDDTLVRSHVRPEVYARLRELAVTSADYNEFCIAADVYFVDERIDIIGELCVAQDYYNELERRMLLPTFTIARFKIFVSDAAAYYRKKFQAFREAVKSFWRTICNAPWQAQLVAGLSVAGVAFSAYQAIYVLPKMIRNGVQKAEEAPEGSWTRRINEFCGLVDPLEPTEPVAETVETLQQPKPLFRTETKEQEQRPRPVFRTENLASETVELDRLPMKKFVTEANKLEDMDDFHSVTSELDVPKDTVAQASADQNAQEIMAKLKYNTYVLFTFNDKTQEWLRMNNVVMVKGRVGITIAHCIPFLQERCKLVGIGRSTYCIEFNLSQCGFSRLANSQGLEVDAMAIEFPNNVVQHANIMSHFQTREDLQSFNIVKSCLLSMKCVSFNGGLIACPDTLQLPYVKSQEELRYELKGSSQTEYMLRHGYIYRAETANGDCGALLIAFNPKLTRKILGIHVAGSRRGTNEGLGASQLITQGMLEQAFKRFSFEGQISFDAVEDTTFSSDVPQLEGDFLPIGLLSKIPPTAVRTSLRRSKLYDKIIRPKTKPAHLRPFLDDEGNKIDPKLLGIKKNGVTPLPIDPVLIDRVKCAVQSSLGTSDVEKRVFTLAEAIQGLEDDEYVRPINRKTSPGYPWIFNKRGKRGKTRWLGSDENYIVDDPELMARIEKRLRMAKQGIRMPALWIDTLKDERRPIAKVDKGKTRVFNAGPMDYIILFRQYFLAFIAHMMKAKIYNESNVGINPYSSDWHMLARYLREVGDEMFAGDFSNFDGSLHPQIMWAILDIVNDWYRLSSDDTEQVEEDCRVRTVLFSCIVNAIHVVVTEHEGKTVAFVYCCTHAQPSGNAFTTVLNTLYNKFGFRIVFVKVTGLDLSRFAKCVRCAFFGDDSIVSVHPSLIDVFNQTTIADAFKTIGMTYTDEQKSGNLILSTSLENLNFLKRGFKMDDTLCRYVGPLDLDVVLEMPMWVKTEYDDITRCSTTVEQCYGELAIHGKEVFSEWASFIDKLCRRHLTIPPPLFHYIEYKDKDLRRN